MNERKFWKIMDSLDWNNAGNDDLVVEPAVETLSKLSDEEIFEFEEIMSKLLYDIDGQQWYDEKLQMSGDEFLYTRCVTIINGKDYYYSIKNLKTAINPDREFESALYIPRMAWARKHDSEPYDYPHLCKFSHESFSNTANWPHLN